MLCSTNKICVHIVVVRYCLGPEHTTLGRVQPFLIFQANTPCIKQVTSIEGWTSGCQLIPLLKLVASNHIVQLYTHLTDSHCVILKLFVLNLSFAQVWVHNLQI